MNKQLYKTLLDKTSLAYIFLEVIPQNNEYIKTKVLDYNDRFKKYFEITHSVLGVGLEEIFDGLVLERLNHIITQAINSKEKKTTLKKDRYEYTVEAFNLDKNIVALIFKDKKKIIDKHININNDLDRSKLLLLNNLPGMVYRCKFDQDWTMEYVSDGSLELTGYSPESLLGNREISYNSIIVDEYRTKIWEKWENVVNEKALFKHEYPIKTKSDEIKWVYEQGQPIFDKDGKVTVLEGVIVDIDEQKERENEINYLTHYDVMTGVYNRRYYNLAIKKMDREEYLPLSIIIGDINGLKLINDAFGHEIGDNMIIRTAELLKNNIRNTDILSRTGGDEFAIFLPNTSNDVVQKVVDRITMDSMEINSDTNYPTMKISISLGFSTRESMNDSVEDTIKLAEDDMYKNKLFEHKSTHTNLVDSIKESLIKRGEESEESMWRLESLANHMITRLELNKDLREKLILLVAVHDIGKIAIDTEVLNKKDPLTPEEWKIIKKHPEMGYRIAMASIELAAVAEYILSHHERWDGKGYPEGLKGEEIPLLSRIVAIVDAYDAMLTDKPYRKKLTKEQAVEELKKNAGTQFDPELVESFIITTKLADH